MQPSTNTFTYLHLKDHITGETLNYRMTGIAFRIGCGSPSSPYRVLYGSLKRSRKQGKTTASLRPPLRRPRTLPELSRKHCMVTSEEGSYVVHDLGSRTGTYVNGVRVSPAGKAGSMQVKPGDIIGLIPSENGFLLEIEFRASHPGLKRADPQVVPFRRTDRVKGWFPARDIRRAGEARRRHEQPAQHVPQA